MDRVLIDGEVSLTKLVGVVRELVPPQMKKGPASSR